jgi:hypothetical protein
VLHRHLLLLLLLLLLLRLARPTRWQWWRRHPQHRGGPGHRAPLQQPLQAPRRAAVCWCARTLLVAAAGVPALALLPLAQRCLRCRRLRVRRGACSCWC